MKAVLPRHRGWVGLSLFAALLVTLLIGSVGNANAGTTCSSIDACKLECDDGKDKDKVEACTEWGLRLMAPGKTQSPKTAVGAFRAACGIKPDWLMEFGKGDGKGCWQLAQLLKDGWLFEVERDVSRHLAVVYRASNFAARKCVDTDTSGCATAAQALLELNSQNKANAEDAKRPLKLAEKGCVDGKDLAACTLLRSQLWNLEYRDQRPDEAARLRKVTAQAMLASCIKDGGSVCGTLRGELNGADLQALIASVEKRCVDGEAAACASKNYWVLVYEPKDTAKVKLAAQAIFDSCSGVGSELCAGMLEGQIRSDVRFGLKIEPATALAIAVKRCDAGDNESCRVAGLAYSDRGPPALRDATKATLYSERSCAATLPSKNCIECTRAPELPSCKLRTLVKRHEQCLDSAAAGSCEQVANGFLEDPAKDPKDRVVPFDYERAAKLLRRGCDSADKGACAALDTVCTKYPDLAAETCAQALIHNDLFYEAEYQLAAGGNLDLVEAGKPPTAVAPTITVGDVVANAPTSYRRGKLDADLVVNVVLDRARQAAITLVVDKLLTAERKQRYRYLRDLLVQGAALLSDPSTLRREKFADLGMTVVRAFVAANLIDGLYPSGTQLLKISLLKNNNAAAQMKVVAGQALTAEVHGYLVDVAYYWLGQTPLFGGTPGRIHMVPSCPWNMGDAAQFCVVLGERANAEKVIGVDRVLDGLRLARALRDGGFDDLRRLIEASARSSTIADFASTPGLSLNTWQSRIIVETRDRLTKTRSGFTALRLLSRASVFSEAGFSLPELVDAAKSARAALDVPGATTSIGAEHTIHIRRLVSLIETLDRESKANDAATGEAEHDHAVTPALSQSVMALAKLRRDATQGIRAWSDAGIADFSKRLDGMEASMDQITPALARLDASILQIRALFARYPKADGKTATDVDSLPLYAMPELKRELQGAVAALVAVDEGLRTMAPGQVSAQLRFARSATVRLLGFLDLMDRIARSSKLTMRAGDVIAALRILGGTTIGLFDAPLYDVLEPVIDAIRAHEPMSLELLFTVIARVRLDTLIGALQGNANACANDASADCWTTKLIHALQESVERDGGQIRIDGGKFAERLANHGDDFRKRHTWRGFLHLTVGVGGLYTDPISDTAAGVAGGSQRRGTPLIAEQLGVGLASPAFWKNRLTFKVGTAASGVLYRALLDSEESNAIMVHPVFLALDIGELVEIYASPAMLMFYPPSGENAAALRWGASVGVSVPLSAYLERR
ncbi:MAG: hypothetical protein KBG15_13275 [Kofleriaceae bacterium]|nr:hypothetical protein [Kofleriaceae bacterium]